LKSGAARGASEIDCCRVVTASVECRGVARGTEEIEAAPSFGADAGTLGGAFIGFEFN